MKEVEWMRRTGQLYTEKQYKKCLSLIIFSLVFSGVITLAGGMIAILTDNANVVIAGIMVGIVGFMFLMISLVYIFKKSAKLQLYRHFKKYPEDFKNEIEQLN